MCHRQAQKQHFSKYEVIVCLKSARWNALDTDRAFFLQVRVIALGCTADLLKDPRAKKAAIAEEQFIPTLLQALEVRHAICCAQNHHLIHCARIGRVF